jgi:GWxTD domain-containing protein
MKQISHIIFAITILATALVGCRKGTSLSNTNLNEIYSSSVDLPQPQFKVFHLSDVKTEIYFKINNQKLTYGVSESTGKLQAAAKISWELFDSFESSQISDSGNVHMIDTVSNGAYHFLQGKISLNCAKGNHYQVKVKLRDENTGKEAINFIQIDKVNPLGYQNYKVTLAENNAILYRNYIYPNEKVIIEFNKDLQQEMYVKYFPTKFSIASRPYSFDQPAPFNFNDFTTQTLNPADNKIEVSFDKEGIYQFVQTKSERKSGLTLFMYNEQFPEINTLNQIIAPLRYITAKKEYQKLTQYQDLKKASDDFWIRCGKDREKTKKLIKGYYGRVAYANSYFTSFKEGWKTDRGSIYIIFGPPAIVYKSLTGESWTYGEESQYQSLTFSFTRNDNPVTDNDYSLVRSSLYKNPYYRAADAWRQGKVESLDY